MSSLDSLNLTEEQVTILGLSLGVGLVLLVLCLAWCCFCVSVCKDKRTQAKVRKRWKNAIERARQMSRRARSGRGRRVQATQVQSTDGMQPSGPSSQQQRNERRTRPDNPQRHAYGSPLAGRPVAQSTPHHIDDINRVVMETIERSRSHPDHMSLASISANRSRSPPGPPTTVHHTHRIVREESDSDDDGDILLPRAKVGPNQPPPSYSSCLNRNADNASRVNYVSATHEFAGASAPPLPGAVPTPIMQRRGYAPYNPEYTFMEEWPTQL